MKRRACIVLLLFVAAAHLPAQQRLAEGRILTPGSGDRPRPVAGEWIVLHRVGSDRAGPLDSARSGRDGRFRFRYRASGDPQALYFVSARYQGIAYFSPPLRGDTVRGEDADIIVYETTSDTSALRLQGRHIVASTPRGDGREMAEVFEIDNSGTRTIVARDSLTPLWTVRLPASARTPAVAPGDVAAGAVIFREGRADLFAPLSPGVRQLMLTYTLPTDTRELTVPLERGVSVLEVLLEEPRAVVSGAGLQEVAPGIIEGRQFRRFLAQDVPPASVVRLALPAPVGSPRSALLLLGIGVGVAMLAALAVWGLRARTRGAMTVTPEGSAAAAMSPAEPGVERLVAELATLDARFERQAAPSVETRVVYERERAALKARIAEALAARDARG